VRAIAITNGQVIVAPAAGIAAPESLSAAPIIHITTMEMSPRDHTMMIRRKAPAPTDTVSWYLTATPCR
jgi:hypothetical protein